MENNNLEDKFYYIKCNKCNVMNSFSGFKNEQEVKYFRSIYLCDKYQNLDILI